MGDRKMLPTRWLPKAGINKTNPIIQGLRRRANIASCLNFGIAPRVIKIYSPGGLIEGDRTMWPELNEGRTRGR